MMELNNHVTCAACDVTYAASDGIELSRDVFTSFSDWNTTVKVNCFPVFQSCDKVNLKLIRERFSFKSLEFLCLKEVKNFSSADCQFKPWLEQTLISFFSSFFPLKGASKWQENEVRTLKISIFNNNQSTLYTIYLFTCIFSCTIFWLEITGYTVENYDLIWQY